MAGPNRWVHRLMMLLGLAHIGYAAATQSTWADVAADGFWNAVEPVAEREADFWFLIAGAALLALGVLTRSHVTATGRVPGALGGWLLVIGTPIAVTIPASGGWLLIVLGVLALSASSRRETTLT